MTDIDHVTLNVPARGEYARTVRLVAAELAARAGMSIDDVDDMRLAVEEAFVYATGPSEVESVACSFGLKEGSLELLVGPLPRRREQVDSGDASGRYATFILEAMCDEFELLERDDGCYVRLVKRTA